MTQSIKEKLKKGWPVLIIVKYLFSLYITILAFRTMRNFSYILVGVTELVAIILISNALLRFNKYVGHIVHFSLLLLYNIQMLMLCFAGSFTTLVMLTNVNSLHDLHGKFDVYLRLIVPMLACTAIPTKQVQMKKISAAVLISATIGLEAVALIIVGSAYSPIYNIYQLHSAQRDYRKMNLLANEVSADATEFYHTGVDDYIRRPDTLREKPNIVLIFVEGLSENIFYDSRNIMPNVRRLESESLHFTNYYNHTFATYRGLMGQLYSGHQLNNLDDNLLISMQSILKSKGYLTTFINTEPTNKDFSNYLASMQFDNLVTDMDMVDYKAAYIHDKYAYDLLYDTIEKQSISGEEPFFTSIYTFGTHVSLDSPDETYADGTNAMLNKFYNMDYQFGKFLDKFEKSPLFENTILIFSTDHATYADEDFLLTFPDYERINPHLDKIPLFIYHKGVQTKAIDVRGRNSLDLAPTILDYIDISEGNFFLGRSLFAPQSKELSCDTIFYDSFYNLNTNHAQIEQLSETQYFEFADSLVKYFSIKGSSDNVTEMSEDYVTAIISEDCDTMAITMRSVSDYQYENIQFAVWSAINDQDDLAWYQATQNDEGDWCYTVNLSEHGDKGSYLVHVYDGKESPPNYIGSTTVYVTDYPPNHLMGAAQK